MADAGVVMVLQAKARRIAPLLPAGGSTLAAQNALIGDEQQGLDEVQARIQVNLQGGQNVFF